jgi:hypothetical protein
MLRPVLIIACCLASVAVASAYECPIGTDDVLQVTKWSAERVDDQWTKTVATLRNISGAEVLPVRMADSLWMALVLQNGTWLA